MLYIPIPRLLETIFNSDFDTKEIHAFRMQEEEADAERAFASSSILTHAA